jgi:hypothetical protein
VFRRLTGNVKEVVYSHPGFRRSPSGPPGIAVAHAFDYLTEVHGDSASRANFGKYGGGSLESREYALRVRRGNLAAGQLADGRRRMAQDGSACGRGYAVRCERGGMDWGVRRRRMGQAGEKRSNSEDKGADNRFHGTTPLGRGRAGKIAISDPRLRRATYQ